MFQFQQQFAEFDPVNAEVNYKPHITVAYRDLKHEQFVKAWSEYQFKKFHAVFGVNNFWLLKHIKHKWECIAEFKLQ
jgi:2'-5' RNA ligase